MQLSSLKICILAAGLGRGGAERQLYYLLSALQQSGAAVRLLSFTSNDFWEGRIRELGVPITPLVERPSKLGRLMSLVKILRRESPDVFQSQHFYTGAYVGLVSRLLGIPGIGALRSNGVMEVKDSGSVAGWLSLRGPKIIAANSKQAIRYAESSGLRSDRLFFLPNVVDTSVLRPADSPSGGPIRLVAVGTLHQCKRFDRFLEILARLRGSVGDRVTGLIVGDGPLRGQLEEQASRLGLMPGGVEFRGSVSNVAPVFREAQIAVLTSEYEGTPNVLLEAMATGLPVVASRVGGVPEIVVEGQNGFLVEAEDLGGFVNQLTRLIQEPSLRTHMGNTARAYVESHHSLNALPPKLTALYSLAVSA
ncbi:MAG: glycosyltransferase [Verrucomicrobiales bacterium]|nr:glycosyltransferase [Verrucomicrobiales bacterium]